MPNKQKNVLTTVTLSIAAVIAGAYLQLSGQNKVSEKCSYLDPITIDIFATIAALFLIIEGIADIEKNKDNSSMSNIGKILRVTIGFSVLTIHIIQFIHK